MTGEKRRLAAILVADVVGYSRLMGVDESGTVAALRGCREVIDPLLARHGGRIFGTAGDSVLAEFGSVVAAVQAAVDLQLVVRLKQETRPEAQRIVFRVGVASGDVIVDGQNLLGDGVNIAARLEGLAEPGGIIISGTVREQVEGKARLSFDDLGEQALKNIARPVRAHRVIFAPDALSALAADAPRRARSVALPLAVVGAAVAAGVLLAVVGWWGLAPQIAPKPLAPGATQNAIAEAEDNRPGLIVLPFNNLSNDPEQEFFADGLTEDITNELAGFSDLRVLASNTAATFTGKAANAKQIGQELGVRYIMTGSVQKLGDRLRLNAQLIDAATGSQLWSEKYDRPLADLFIVQDEIMGEIVTAAGGAIGGDQRKRVLAASPETLDAYELTLRAYALNRALGLNNRLEARKLIRQAVERDRNYAPAWSLLAIIEGNILSANVPNNPEFNDPATARRALDAGLRATQLAPGDAVARNAYAAALRRNRQFDAADAEAAKALGLGPNNVTVLNGAGVTFANAQRWEESSVLFRKLLRLDPYGGNLYGRNYAIVLYHQRKYPEAASMARECVERAPTEVTCSVLLAAALAQLGKNDDARLAAAELERRSPSFRISVWARGEMAVDRNSVPSDHLAEGLRKAGVPE